MNTLTKPESSRLKALEKTIAAGKKIFVAVGLALVEIREARLYREKFATFEDYCQERWGWSRQRGHQLIEAATVVEALPREMSTMVNSERQARELANVAPAERVDVLARAQEAGGTAAAIVEASEAWTPNLAAQSMIEKICSLWTRFQNLTGKPEAVLLSSVNLMREIGLHLQGLNKGNSRLSNAKFIQLRDKLPEQLNFENAKVCVSFANKYREKATLEEAGHESRAVFKVRGNCGQDRHRTEKQHSTGRTPFIVVSSALGSARQQINHVYNCISDWDEQTRKMIRRELEDHAAWIEKKQAEL